MKTAAAFLLASVATVGTVVTAFVITKRDGSVLASSNSNSNSNSVGLQSLSNSRIHSRSRLNLAPESPAAIILSEVGSHDVVVFSKSYCPFCTSTKSLFEKIEGVDARVIELDERDDGADIQSALLEKTGQRTVPSVFVKGEHIGGNDATQAAFRSGDLTKKLGI